MSVNTQILNILQVIQTDISGIKTDVQQLKTDVQQLKTDVQQLKTDVQQLKTDVQQLKTDVLSLTDWRMKISANTEEETNILFEKEFRAQYSTSRIVRSYLRNFYTITSNNQITDIDGCFLINSKEKIQKRAMTKEMKKIKKKIILPNNTSTTGIEISHTIFIENKLSIDKLQIDEKIMMYQHFLTALKDAKGDLPDGHFKNMAEVYDVANFPSDLILIFACDTITPLLQQYIISINNEQITNETDYKLTTFSILEADQTYRTFHDACIKYFATSKPTMSISIKAFFEELKNNNYIKSYDKLKDVIDFITTNQQNNVFKSSNITDLKFNAFKNILITWEKCIPYLKDCMTNFTVLHPEMKKLKNHIGYMKRDKIVSSLVNNQLSGHI